MEDKNRLMLTLHLQSCLPDTGAVVLVTKKHTRAAIVIVGGDGASFPSVVLKTPLGGLQLAVALNLVTK